MTDRKQLVERAPEPGPDGSFDDWQPKSVADVVERMRLPGGGYCARPTWLQPFVDVLDRAVLHGDAWATCSAPPQHSKSTTMIAALLFAAIVRPGQRHIYASYAQSRADDAASELEAHALDLGLDPHRTGPVVQLRGGTIVLFTSVEGSVTGKPCSGLALLDDPVKGSQEARSPTIQRTIARWYSHDLMTRLHPPSADGTRQGASMIVVATRWVPEDLIGTLQRETRDDADWTHLRLPAVCDDPDAPEQQGRELGAALWPAERPLSYLTRHQRDPKKWAAEYQGLPVADEERIFNNPPRYTQLPPNGRRWGFGLDTAGSVKQSADYNVLIEGCSVEGVLYVTDFRRQRQELTRWVPDVAAPLAKRRIAAVVLFGSSAGDNVACELFLREGVRVHLRQAKEDKLIRVRKYGVAELWAAGKIMFPEQAGIAGREWDTVIEECLNFTGDGRGHDDFVDALVGLVVAVGLTPSYSGVAGAPFTTRLKGIRRGMHEPGRSLAADWLGSGGARGDGVLVDMGRDR